MKPAKLLIIHGYSDCSESFKDIRNFLAARYFSLPQTIYYADYQSREDALTFNDVADGLNDKLIEEKIIHSDGSSDYDLKVIVHSTGGLVLRHWLWRYYHSCGNADNCPVKNIIMLAPANFGSPLAHRGRSFLGSLVKGRWSVGDFLEVGRELLFGLELASPYQWKLAHRDLLSDTNPFRPDAIKTTIIVGDTDYTGLRGWVNKAGTDGTVVISGTNINSVKLTLGFAKRDSTFNADTAYQWSVHGNASNVAFGVLPGFNHGSIVEDAHQPSAELMHPGNIILKGLTDDLGEFTQFIAELAVQTEKVYSSSGKPKFQQFIVHAIDDHDESVNDFTMEFLVYKKKFVDQDRLDAGNKNKSIGHYSQRMEEIICCEMHQHTIDRSYRRFLVDHSRLFALLDEIKRDPKMKEGFVITMRVHVPPVEKNIKFKDALLRNVVIYDSTAGEATELPNLFFPNTTTLMELQVDRTNGYVWVGEKPREQ